MGRQINSIKRTKLIRGRGGVLSIGELGRREMNGTDVREDSNYGILNE